MNLLALLQRNFRLALRHWGSILALVVGTDLALAARDRVSFNDGWLFAKDDPAGAGETLSYGKLKSWLLSSAAPFTKNNPELARAVRPQGNVGEEVAYTRPGFDDRAWRQVTLPHDWAIEGRFQPEYSGWCGKRKWWGAVWYRKHFTLPATDAGKQICLDLDGAMSYASVWLNGQFVGGWPYGYTSWRADLTPFVKPGTDNLIAIRLDNPPDSSRWYPGGGIYRNVWLLKMPPVHVGQNGVQVVPVVEKDVPSSVAVSVTVENHTKQEVAVRASTKLFELRADGRRGRAVQLEAVKDTVADCAIPAGQSRCPQQTLFVKAPRLWSVDHPNRYVAVTRVTADGGMADEVETPFGFRTMQFTKDNGFLLNGERVPLQGVCDHHDLGALGSALNTRALERQLEILRAMGCNAIRTSHNPPAPELLDLCDRLGLLVMAEAFDCWRVPKCKQDYSGLYDDWHEADLRAFVRRDRNHPSVVLWSIGNEIPEQADTNRLSIARELAAIVKEEDPSRPVTSACNNSASGYNGFQDVVDVFGYNYMPGEYARFRATHPGIPLFGSETASCVSSRGEYFFPVSEDKSKGLTNCQVSSYDLCAPDWEFKGLDENPGAAGEFVWTGFDYLGEPTPYGEAGFPARSSYFGIIDLAGFPKDRYYIYQAHWRPEFRMAHILPHWTWPERVGQVTPVHVYTSGDSAELFLNGKSLGRKSIGKFEYRLRWDNVVYQPGELKVVAYKNGKLWATNVMRTAGPAAKLALTPDRDRIAADGRDLCFVKVKVADRNGVLVPRSDHRIHFEIRGPGEIVATDNGDATSLESFQTPERKAYNGLALVIVRARPGQPGKITLAAESQGLKAGACVIRGVTPADHAR
jgi:beta-galactosidase